MWPADVSVCVVTHNGGVRAANAVRSALSDAGRLRLEVAVVDNGSSDGTADLLRSTFPDANVMRIAGNPGYAPSMNSCISRTQGEFILALSQDASVHRGTLQTLVDFMRSHPRAGIAGPRTVREDGEVVTTLHHPNLFVTVWTEIVPIKAWLRRSAQARQLLTRLAPNSSGLTSDYGVTRQASVVDGGCVMLRRECLAEVGQLDEMLPQGPDDYDLCFRAWSTGWQVWYVAEAVATHNSSPREDFHELPPQIQRTHLAQLCHLYGKYHQGLDLVLFRLSAFLFARKQMWQAERLFGRSSASYAAAQLSASLCLSERAYRRHLRHIWPT